MTEAVDSFFDAWGLDDDSARADAIAQVYAAAGTYADPRSPALLTGAKAITDYVAMFSANAPGWTARVTKRDTTAGCMRVTVAFGGKGPDGTDMVQHGQYFVEMDGTEISRMIGFVGTGEVE